MYDYLSGRGGSKSVGLVVRLIVGAESFASFQLTSDDLLSILDYFKKGFKLLVVSLFLFV